MTRGTIFILLALIFAGCNREDQTKDAIDIGDKRMKLGAYPEAIRSYESALDGTPKTADVHYKLAVLYDDKLKAPLSAMHHYERYLDLAPEGAHAKEAKSAHADCEKKLNVTMKEGGFMTLAEGARLKNENETLRKQNAELRVPKTPVPPRVPTPGGVDPAPAGSRKHVVAKGETLASIASKYYQNRAQSKRIKDANFNQLGGKDTIKAGMILIIPEGPKKKQP